MKKTTMAAVAAAGLALAGGAALAQAPSWYGPFEEIPGGSYQRSCRDITAYGGRVYARCRDGSNTLVQTDLNYRSCNNGRVENSNGRLRCEGGWGGGPGGPGGPGGGWGGGPGGGYGGGPGGPGGGYGGGPGGGYGGPGGGYQPFDNGCRGGSSPSLLLFENPDYRGAKLEVCDSIQDLAASGLDDQITSVRLLRGQWQLCAGRDFGGQCWTVDADKANLKDVNMNDKVTSIRRLRR